MTDIDADIIYQSMKFILEGNYIDDFEFQTRLGLTRQELQVIARSWPQNHSSAESITAACNSINEVCNGLTIDEVTWNRWFNFSRNEADDVIKKCREVA